MPCGHGSCSADSFEEAPREYHSAIRSKIAFGKCAVALSGLAGVSPERAGKTVRGEQMVGEVGLEPTKA
ncbi:hypothetical protein MPC4_140093 [Methylocella tundrae]|uniref:Uncharacterized protein n=1 Tax=Methylocella tundrae TaxID=227605 RepID=A0A8B6M327_METTU|nr:hypothetical protein MPC4_140093 [Methylocella tundrae]